MAQATSRQILLVKVFLFLAALVPLAWLVWDGVQGRLSPNPVEAITHRTGDWILNFLLLTLAITPLRKISGWHWLLRLRRMLGLFAFFYAFLHFTTYIWLDQFFDLSEVWKDIAKRPYITVGFTAFVLLIPLALTSTNAMVKRLGGKRWRRLHRLVYIIASAGVLHYLWLVKSDIRLPLAYGFVLAILLVLRIPSVNQRITATQRA
ncbi:MAG: sulfite oxidase [Acidithiobacillales bacterium SG8_45]|jgi:sulfoxide reductase heme-binding subunit YedZ|nr:MAG: sulfite oxidase [Acidithiobacillales bacterium SG8_45]